LVYFSLHIVRVNLGLGRYFVGVPLRLLLHPALLLLLLHRLCLHARRPTAPSRLIEFAPSGLLPVSLIAIVPALAAADPALLCPALTSATTCTGAPRLANVIALGRLELILEVKQRALNHSGPRADDLLNVSAAQSEAKFAKDFVIQRDPVVLFLGDRVGCRVVVQLYDAGQVAVDDLCSKDCTCIIIKVPG
jgi:hypothetical protein